MMRRVCLGPRIRRCALASDNAGVTAVEFALIAPVFLMIIAGSLDLGHMVYAKSILDGAVEKAARDSTLETANTAAADNIVKTAVQEILPDAQVTATRKSYYDFNNTNRGEELDDVNGDGQCSPGEAYTDLNGNDSWDADLGVNGNGGANDVIVYTVKVTYAPVFAMPVVPLNWSTREISATAVKRNQPFGKQNGNYSARPKVC